MFNGGAGNPGYVVVTDADHATIPDLREQGLDLPAGTAYTWQVVGLAAYASVDAAVSDEDGLLSSWWLNPVYQPKHDGAWAALLVRHVTTAP